MAEQISRPASGTRVAPLGTVVPEDSSPETPRDKGAGDARLPADRASFVDAATAVEAFRTAPRVEHPQFRADLDEVVD